MATLYKICWPKLSTQQFWFCPHFSWAELKDLRLFLWTQKAYFSQILAHVQLMKNGGKIKSVAFIILVSVDKKKKNTNKHVCIESMRCACIEKAWDLLLEHMKYNRSFVSLRADYISSFSNHKTQKPPWPSQNTFDHRILTATMINESIVSFDIL